MNIRMTHLARGVCISAALLCLAGVAGAVESARQFAGTYVISDVIKSGNSVQLTMKFTLLNPTSKAVNDGVITVLAATPIPQTIGKFGAIETIPRIGRATVTETFTISAAEYAKWEAGNSPHFEFLIPGEDGTTTAGIQAHRLRSAVDASGT